MQQIHYSKTTLVTYIKKKSNNIYQWVLRTLKHDAEIFMQQEMQCKSKEDMCGPAHVQSMPSLHYTNNNSERRNMRLNSVPREGIYSIAYYM